MVGTASLSVDLPSLLLAAGAGLVCSFLNTVASSGSAVSLPLLMLIGLDPITANGTNRIPVLIGALTATASFHRSGHMPWAMGWKICIPVTIGALLGAGLAEVIPAKELGLVITCAVLMAFILLFTKVKKAVEMQVAGDMRFGWKQIAIIFAIGLWLGFIVLDGATFMLLALVLAVGFPLVKANAVKNLVLVPTAAAAIAVFASKGSIHWGLAIAMGLGSIFGGLIGARLAVSDSGKKWIVRVLAFVLVAEIIHLAVHYIFKTT